MEWIYWTCTWSVYLKHAIHLTHIFHIFFTDFDEWCRLWCALDLVWRRREQGGQDGVFAGAERRIPESASLDIVWTLLLKLSAEVIPEPLPTELCVGEDTKHPDYYQRRSH